MKKISLFTATVLVFSALFLSACELPKITPRDQVTATPTVTPPVANTSDETLLATIAALQAQAVVEPTESIVTQIPTITPTPTAIPALNWVEADRPYENKTILKGGQSFTGPGICEWWDQRADGFGHEGFVYLKENEVFTMPASLPVILKDSIGTCWNVEIDDQFIGSYRHLLFYADKKQHGYMSEYLRDNNFGNCNFDDQTGCAELAKKVVVLPFLTATTQASPTPTATPTTTN